MSDKLQKLKQDFLDEWPLSRLVDMQIDEYTNTNREDSFCYWVEHVTRDLGSIVGGSSYKFGIFKKGSDTPTEKTNYRNSDGTYAWHTKYNETTDTAQEAFENIRALIVNLAKYAKDGNLEAIDEIDLGTAYKWKIAFLYSDYNVLNIFKLEALRFIAKNLQIPFEKKTVVSIFHKEILKRKGDKDFFEFYNHLWHQYYEGLINVKYEFAEWLDKKTHDSYRNYLGKDERAIQERLEEINGFFDEIDFFLVNPENIEEHINTIALVLSKIEREKKADFVEYDLKNSNGIPKALLGKNNYIQFLKEKFEYESKEIIMLENLVEEFKEYLVGYADLTIKIYSNNFELFIKNYLSQKNLNHLEEQDYIFFTKVSYSKYERGTFQSFEHKGKGHVHFIEFFETKLENEEKQIINTSINQILYGPPGTGKTYATKKLAVELIDNISYEDNEEARKFIVQRYNELHELGQLVFTTFHQSLGYEDFVEGIKPKVIEGLVTYEVEDGIFKKLANKAKGIKGNIVAKNNSIDFKNKNYFKMSIGGRHRKDIHKWCMENNYIALGYGSQNDLSSLAKLSESDYKKQFPIEFSDEYERTSYSVTATATFIYSLKVGDVVLVSLGNHIIDAVGVIEGEYEYNEFEEIPFRHFRKVKWLGTNLEADPNLFVDKNISQQTIYQFNYDDIKLNYIEQTFGESETENEPNDYVLIIDEINRGNISAIFGELITLLEPDKRLGQDEAITVKLPYSKTDFGIPSNLHIIGTMNTADRSVEALDTALRRRFEFKEMMPKPDTLKDISFNLNETSFTLEEVLTTTNLRITSLLDRDYTIGHSYFINIKSGDTKGLANAFNNKVIPLLQEYFYGDYGKIGLVLGNDFVVKDSEEEVVFANFEYENKDDLQQVTYKLLTKDEDTIVTALISMLGK